MKLTEMQKNAAVIVLAVLVIAIAVYMLLPQMLYKPNLGAPATGQQFFSMLSNSSSVALVFDLTGTPEKSPYRDRLLQCGVGIAGSSGIAALNKTIFALESDKCTIGSGAKTSQDCYYLARGMPMIKLQAGPSDKSEFFANAMVITLSPSYNSSCAINANTNATQ